MYHASVICCRDRAVVTSDRRTLDITPEADRVASFDRRIGPGLDPDLERDIERGIERGLRDLPQRIEPFLNFNWRDGGIPGPMSPNPVATPRKGSMNVATG